MKPGLTAGWWAGWQIKCRNSKNLQLIKVFDFLLYLAKVQNCLAI